MAFSYEDFTGDGTTTLFNVNKPYIAKSHVGVTVDGVTATFTWSTSAQINMDTAPANGTTVRVARTTPKTPLTDFADGSTLVEADLDRALLQSLYVAQEVFDTVAEKMAKTGAGVWDALSVRIINVADPTAAQDAATKQYVDDTVTTLGNVPAAADPGDDGKALVASGGSWAWTSISILASAISDATAFGRSLLQAADAAAGRALLALGTAATKNTGTSGATVPLLNGANTWAAAQTLGAALAMQDNEIGRAVLKDYGEAVNALGSIGGGTQDIDLELGNVVTGTVDTAETTFTFSNPPATGTEGGFKMYLLNGGAQTVNWPVAVKWPGGEAPTLTVAGTDILVFVTTDGGTTWYGFVAGQEMS